MLKQRVSALEKKVLPDLEDQLGGETVVVAGAEFSSLNEAGAWLTLNTPSKGDYTFFLDAHGLVALGYGCGTTTQEVLKMDEYKEKVKFSSIDAALIAAGFQIAIPEFFSVRLSDKSVKALLSLSTASDWDARDGDRGLRSTT
jgi:hypothetical protein